MVQVFLKPAQWYRGCEVYSERSEESLWSFTLFNAARESSVVFHQKLHIVQCRQSSARLLLFLLLLSLCLAGSAFPLDKDKKDNKDKNAHQVTVPVLLLDGGRKLVFEGTFSMEREVKPKRGFWKKGLEVVAGEPQFKILVRPFGVVTDSRGRIIVTDPGAGGVHIFDFKEEK